MDKTNKALAQAQGRFIDGWRPKRLLGDNTKLAKADKLGFRNLGLSLAPANVSGFQVCASASPECVEHCIFTSGKGQLHNVMWSRIFRTLWFFQDRPGFMSRLYHEISQNQDAAIRLNVFSDWMWERQSFEIEGVGKFRNLMEAFPNTQFYDYTKHFKRMFRPMPDNYHLTFSLHEANAHQAKGVLQAGKNVAAIVSRQEGFLFGQKVFDGDDHDLRFLDPTPSVVGLKPKGSLTQTLIKSEMIYEPDRELLPEARAA